MQFFNFNIRKLKKSYTRD